MDGSGKIQHGSSSSNIGDLDGISDDTIKKAQKGDDSARTEVANFCLAQTKIVSDSGLKERLLCTASNYYYLTNNFEGKRSTSQALAKLYEQLAQTTDGSDKKEKYQTALRFYKGAAKMPVEDDSNVKRITLIMEKL